MRVSGVGPRDDHRQVDIRVPGDERAGDAGLAVQGTVLVVGGVVVAPREQRPDDQADRVGRVGRLDQAPPDHRARFAARHHDLLADARPVRGAELPRRPRLRRERLDARGAVRVHDVGHVALARERHQPRRRLEPGLEAVDEHDAAGRRCRRRQQQRVIAPRADAVDRARGKPAQAISLQPFSYVVPKRCGHESDAIRFRRRS